MINEIFFNDTCPKCKKKQKFYIINCSTGNKTKHAESFIRDEWREYDYEKFSITSNCGNCKHYVSANVAIISDKSKNSETTLSDFALGNGEIRQDEKIFIEFDVPPLIPQQYESSLPLADMHFLFEQANRCYDIHAWDAVVMLCRKIVDIQSQVMWREIFETEPESTLYNRIYKILTNEGEFDKNLPIEDQLDYSNEDHIFLYDTEKIRLEGNFAAHSEICIDSDDAEGALVYTESFMESYYKWSKKMKEYKMKENVIYLNNLDTKIYRIFSFERFSEMITSRTNSLVHPSKWDDPFENFFLKGEVKTSDGTPIDTSDLSKSWYGQCWTMNKDSDAMWRIYSAEKTGVRVETTVRSLFSDFYNSSDNFAQLKYLIGSVEYKTTGEILSFLTETSLTDLMHGGQPHEFAKTLLIKRPEFSHENEVRLLFHDADNRYRQNGDVAEFPFSWDTVLTEVVLDPRLNETDFQLKKQKLISLGCTLPITQSELYKFTPSEIRL